MGGIEAAIAEHAFEHLFIECLGWDRVRSTVPVEHRELSVQLTAIAQKRGFTVFLCPTHRTVLANRGLLRDVQRQLRRSYHEHIVIHSCETPRKQVWQWATMVGDERRILHREHPFFSNDPPPRLLERIEGLSVSFQEEEQTTLPDVLDRVRKALLPDSEQNLFAKHPSYAAESDRRAMAMKRGEPGAFGRFVEFHIPLARHSSRILIRWFGMDADDAEQTAMIGLLEAARRFDPDRGYQFSTYAGFWLRQICQRYGLDWGLSIRVPPHLFWPCYRLTFTHASLIATYGERDVDAPFDAALAAAGVTRSQWMAFCSVRNPDFISDFGLKDQARLKCSDDTAVIDAACSDERCDEIHRGLKRLSARHAEILRLRYGIGEREHTLEEVGERLGITRERVRQLQVRAEEKLQRVLGKMDLFDDGEGQPEVDAECTEEVTQ